MKTVFRSSLIPALGVFLAWAAYAQPTTVTLDPLSGFGPQGNGLYKPGDSLGTNPRNTNNVTIYGTSGGAILGLGIQYDTINVPPVNSDTNADNRTGGATNGFNMRGIAQDPVTGNIIFVDEHSGSGGAQVSTNSGVGGNAYQRLAAVYVLSGTTGQIIGVLNTNGISSSVTNHYCTTATVVTDDGVVYVGNQAWGGDTFRIYRYPTADINAANFNEAPTVAFSGLTAVNLTGNGMDSQGQTMDIRGTGTNTQIICTSAATRASTNPGTNVYVYTTIDGTNYTAHRINVPGITTAASPFNDGVAWGPTIGITNTFLAKRVGQPLLLIGYDPSTFGTNTVITGANAAGPTIGTIMASYTGSSANDPILNGSSIAYNPTSGYLALMEEIGGNATAGNGKIWLYYFPTPLSSPPGLVDNRVYTVNYQKALAPMGYVRFGKNGTVIANVVNNGIMASVMNSATLGVPTYTWTDYSLTGTPVTRVSDLPATTRAAPGATVHFEVFAVAAVTNYQWFTNGVAIAGANSYYLNVTNVTSGMDGIVYQVVAYNAAGSTPSTASRLTVVSPSSFYHLNSIWSSNANTTVLTDNNNFITSGGGANTPNERSIAYNALSNQLLVVRGPVASANTKIFVVNADTGGTQNLLNTNGITASQNATLVGVGVADDGAVYAASVSTSDQSFKIYRWANTAPTTVPVPIFGTNSSSGLYNPINDLTGTTLFRFGDTLAVQGSGANTQMILDSQNNSKYIAWLTPLNDGTMTNWTQYGSIMQNVVWSYGASAYGTTIGRSLQFGPAIGTPFGTFTPSTWQKRYQGATGAPLAGSGYNPGGAYPLGTYNNSNPVFTNGPLAINFTLKVGAALNYVGSVGTDNATTADVLNYYDMTDPSQSVLLSTYPLAGGNSGNHKANGNAIGQVIFGYNPATGSNYVFAINGNNGVNGYVLSGGVTPPPKILSQPSNLGLISGTSGSLNVTVDQIATVSWFKGTNPPVDTGARGSAYTIANAQASDGGDYFAIATNVNGSVTSLVAHITISAVGDHYTLSNIWKAIPGNASFPYVTLNGGGNTPGERGFAYNALSNQLIVVHCPPASTAYSINVVNADTGAYLYSLNTNGIIHEGTSEVSGSNPIDLVAAACADDGAVYISSESPNSSGGLNGDPTKMFHVFRWANSGSSTVPALVYEGDPSGQPANINLRWGDVLTARGSGAGTQLILNNQDGSYGATLTPTDGTLAAFTNKFFTDAAGGGFIGRSVQFGSSGNTVYEKRRNVPMVFSSYDTNLQTSAVIGSYNFGGTTLGSTAVDSTHHLAAGVDFVGNPSSPAVADAVSLFDITDFSSPVLIKSYPFPVTQQANANMIAQVIISGNRVYALDGNNGMMAFSFAQPANWLPVINASPTNLTRSTGGTAVFHVQATTGSNGGSLTYQWNKGGVNLSNGSGSIGTISGSTTADLTIASVTSGAMDSYSVTVSNPYGSTNSATATLTVVNPVPVHLLASVASGTNLVMQGTGGIATGTYTILTSSDVTLPLTNWTVYASGSLDGNGGFNITNAINPAADQRFFVVKQP